MSVAAVDRVPYAVAGFGDLLTHDLARNAPSVQPFFPQQALPEVLRRIAARPYRRAKLCRVLEASARKTGAPEAALASIQLLRAENTFVVATGQQAGLLGGPLLTLHKALTAIKLARQLEAEAGGGARCVPIFWIADDDHDIAEIDHAFLIDGAGELLRARAEIAPESIGCSAADVFLAPEAAHELVQRMRDAGISAGGAARYGEAYHGRSMGEAFALLLNGWLGELGLIAIRASDVRPFAAEILARDLSDYQAVSRLVAEAGLALQNARYNPGFKNARATPHFFIAAEPSKVRAHLDPVSDDEFVERAAALEQRGQAPRRFSRQALTALLAQRPELFSASAVLRPVVQQHVFPVAAAVLGPGEIAYWAQLKNVHDHFGVPWPLVYPRATLTLLDAHAARTVRKLGLQPDSAELFTEQDALARRALVSGETGEKLAARNARILQELDALAADVNAVDGGLKPLFSKARARIENELQRVAEKTQATLGARDEAGARRMRRLAVLLRPRNGPQERVLAGAQFMDGFPELAQDLLAIIDPGAREHLVATLN